MKPDEPIVCAIAYGGDDVRKDYAANLYQTYPATAAPRIASIANTNRLGLSVP
jgi:hypothetical protein